MPVEAYSLEWWLNWTIPVGVILIFCAMFFIKLKEPFFVVGGWIKNFFVWIWEMITGEATQTSEIVYER